MNLKEFNQRLEESITSFEVLGLKYKNSIGVISERDIEPLALYFDQGEWKLIAYCRMRKENILFLVQRFHSLEKTENTFPPNQFRLNDYFKHQPL